LNHWKGLSADPDYSASDIAGGNLWRQPLRRVSDPLLSRCGGQSNRRHKLTTIACARQNAASSAYRHPEKSDRVAGEREISHARSFKPAAVWRMPQRESAPILYAVSKTEAVCRKEIVSVFLPPAPYFVRYAVQSPC